VGSYGQAVKDRLSGTSTSTLLVVPKAEFGTRGFSTRRPRGRSKNSVLEAFDKGGLEGETTRLRSKAKAKNFREVSILGNDVPTRR
jgi:hypothetical protein